MLPLLMQILFHYTSSICASCQPVLEVSSTITPFPVRYTQVKYDITVDVLAGDNLEFRLVFNKSDWLEEPTNVRYPPLFDEYVGPPDKVALEFPCRSVTVVPLPGYDNELLIS